MGGAVRNTKSFRGNWSSKYRGFSLAGLLLAKEKTFPPAGIGKYRLLPIGSAIDGVAGCETTPFWPPRPELFLWASLS